MTLGEEDATPVSGNGNGNGNGTGTGEEEGMEVE